MTTKLNLTIEESTVKKIKVNAEKGNTSVSKIVEQQLQKLLQENKSNKKEKSFVEKWGGFLKGSVPDIDKARDEYLKEKYGL
jgi:hypothetical protein